MRIIRKRKILLTGQQHQLQLGVYPRLSTKIKAMTNAVIVAALVICALSSQAEILEVPTDFATIQAAFAASSDGDTVLLRRGLYAAPVMPPSWNITIAGEYLVTRDTLDIGVTVIAPDSSNPGARCVTAVGGANTLLRLIGLKLHNGQLSNENGGGLFVQGRRAELQYCRITKCVARFGGALAVGGGSLVLKHCRLDHNRSTIRVGNIMYLRDTSALILDSRIGYSIGPAGEGADMEIKLEHASIAITGCLITNIGWLNSYGSFLFKTERNLQAYNVTLLHSTLTNCRITNFFSCNDNSGVQNFHMDSCLVVMNQVAQGLYDNNNGDSTYSSHFVGNVFTENIRPPAWGGMGLLIFTNGHRPSTVTGNLFLNNSIGEQTGLYLTNGATVPREFSHNYFFVNASHASLSPPGGVNTFERLGDSLFFQNVLDGNFGNAAYQSSWVNPPSHCERNYWGSALGPYQAETNRLSDGDSVSSQILYDPFEADTLFLGVEDNHRFVETVPYDFLIGFAYPNPFNNEITIEFVTTKREQIRLDIFDLTGRLVESISEEELDIGIHRRNWNAKNQASGIYFARLSATGSAERAWLHKLVLLK